MVRYDTLTMKKEPIRNHAKFSPYRSVSNRRKSRLKNGGEGGIRTHGPSQDRQFSRLVP